jgi:hypothetical protein
MLIFMLVLTHRLHTDGFFIMAKATTAKEKEEIPEAKIRNAIWYLKTGKTKKFVCEFLNIPYNTARLAKIIEDFRAKEERAKELKEKAKTMEITPAIRKDIASSYINGEAQTAIATRYYISPQRVKAILMEMNVPIRARAKNAAAKTEHIVQDLDIKFKLNDRVFYGPENAFAVITEVYDEEYAERLRQGRQRWVELRPWTEKSRHPEPVIDIHYQIYWELEDGSHWKLDSLKSHIKRVENTIAETGRETYQVWIDTEYAFKKMFVPRSDLFPVVYK